jgi:hypothetical protein
MTHIEHRRSSSTYSVFPSVDALLLQSSLQKCINCHSFEREAALRTHKQFFIRLLSQQHRTSSIRRLTSTSDVSFVTQDFCSKVEVVVIKIHTPMNDQP